MGTSPAGRRPRWPRYAAWSPPPESSPRIFRRRRGGPPADPARPSAGPGVSRELASAGAATGAAAPTKQDGRSPTDSARPTDPAVCQRGGPTQQDRSTRPRVRMPVRNGRVLLGPPLKVPLGGVNRQCPPSVPSRYTNTEQVLVRLGPEGSARSTNQQDRSTRPEVQCRSGAGRCTRGNGPDHQGSSGAGGAASPGSKTTASPVVADR